MPGTRQGRFQKMERALKKAAKKKGFGEKRAGKYVYGAMRRAGWKPRKRR